ncbi:MSCRAMM family protein [Streptomyces sp. NBC_01264]|uniref:MSCRAMM family protein n=1 Tax=Streptomyces sp. NBC_01264 TaxID=2903804 RepID=UPI002258E9D3|nr:SpaA isopeptide-forming pilin-related protein [Streptomyces sp. NBC_01264]MCX4776845.1 SpaA isopeptide-forming pilin-related protein [Streptomyces sp. NBC_01264]
MPSRRTTPVLALTLTAMAATIPFAHASTSPDPSAPPPVMTERSVTTGGIEIQKKDPTGDILAGASFALLDASGNPAAEGKTGADGLLRLEGLIPGPYRLKETASGSPIHDTVADQDVIITDAVTPMVITDPFKAADLIVKKADKETGKPLSGAVINVTPTSGQGETLTLTTGPEGTAKAKLTVSARTGTAYTATETKAPAGYQLTAKPVTVTAKPGAPVTAEFTNSKIPPTQPPSSPPPTSPSTPKPSTSSTPSAAASAAPSATPTVAETASSTTSPAPTGVLANTGGGSARWIGLLGGVLIIAGGGAVWALRRRAERTTP